MTNRRELADRLEGMALPHNGIIRNADLREAARLLREPVAGEVEQRIVDGRLDLTDGPTLAVFIGKSLASFVSGNRMPCMSGDDRERIPAHIRDRFDAACGHTAKEILSYLRARLDDEGKGGV